MSKSKRVPARVLDLVTSTPWAITEPYLRTIVNVVAREEVFPDALAFQEDQEVEDRTMEIRNGTAILPIVGPIYRRANLFMQVSGGVSTEGLALDFGAALRDPQVHSIVLNIDSPGGEASGIAELAETIYRARGIKPVTAYIGDLGASGAYWLATAASEIVASPTALLGSIGVRVAFLDRSEQMAKNGIRSIEIVSSQSPKKVPDPATDDGRSEIQRLIDDLAAVFIDQVARGRGVTPQQVIEQFGAGGILVGQLAVDAGMAERVATFEDVMAQVEENHRQRTNARFAPAAAVPELAPIADTQEEIMKTEEPTTPTATVEPATITAEYVAANHADVAEQFRAEGRTAGATAERERIQAIEKLGGPAEAIAKLKYDPEMTAEKAALQLHVAAQTRKSAELSALEGDEKQTDAPAPGSDSDASSESQEIARTVALFNATHGRAQKQLTA